MDMVTVMAMAMVTVTLMKKIILEPTIIKIRNKLKKFLNKNKIEAFSRLLLLIDYFINKFVFII